MATRRRTNGAPNESSSDDDETTPSQQFERGSYVKRDGISFQFPAGTVPPRTRNDGGGEDYFDLISCLSNPRVLDTPIQFTHELGIGRAAITGFALGLLTALHMGLLCWALMSGNAEQERTDSANALVLWSTYFIALCSYHMLEFITTARYNPGVVTNRSFLINHSNEYTYAVLISWAEFAIELAIFPELKGPAGSVGKLVLGIGLALMVMGQVFRSGAMATAKSNFTHLISMRKIDSHKLVQDGVYRYLRHPSYFGWFWWSISTQLVLRNPICTVLYAGAAWKFFQNRIPFEEETLVSFFPHEYPAYRARTGVGIPFIK